MVRAANALPGRRSIDGAVHPESLTSSWAGLRLVAPAPGGDRNQVWRARIGARDVSVRRSRRSDASFDWELDVLELSTGHGFLIPRPVPADDGRRQVDGVVVQEWLHGRPPSSDDDWHRVADELQRLHRLTGGHPQRPGCCEVGELGPIRRCLDADLDAIPEPVLAQLLEVFADYGDVGAAVIHGDPHRGNIRIDEQGRVGLLDWDESWVGLVWHDLADLGVPALPPADQARAERLANAWEAANAWVLEPAYAARRLRALSDSGNMS